MSIRQLTLRTGLVVACLAAGAVEAQVDLSAVEPVRQRVGEIQPFALSTAHPYVGGIDHVFEIHHPGATYVKVHFERFELAPGDRLVVSNPAGTERYVFSGRGYKDKGHDFWVTSILGDTAILRLQSTHSDGGFGFDIDHYAYGIFDLFSNQPESICAENNALDVECYAVSHPTEYDRARRAVVVLFNGVENCTGFKIGCPNQIMSNEHCVTDQHDVDLTEVRFEYARSGCANGSASFSVGYLGDVFQQDNYTLDYSVFTVQGDSATYPAAELESRLPPVGERIYISGHPGGAPKKLSIEDDTSPTGLCRVDVSPTHGRGANTDIGYYCDSQPGSSGSPVWSGVTHKVIALHHFGGCANGGVRMDLIYPEVEPLLMSCCDTPPELPTVGAVVNGDNRIDVSWDDSDLPDVVEYRVRRARTSGGPYVTVATIADTSPGVGDGAGYVYDDTAVSGGIEYFYVVESTDGLQCASGPSVEASATATGACTLGPTFDGVQSVTAPASLVCTLDVEWNPATPECEGPVLYDVHRSTFAGFDPSPATLIAGGLAGTAFQDTAGLVPATNYFYKVRARDVGTGSSDDNQVQVASLPAAGCMSASACPENPVVDVTPDGPQTACVNAGPTLSANLTGGTGPFRYQWLEDGVPVPGATGAEYTPNKTGASTYNVLVRADACGDDVFDGLPTEITRVDRPFFDGLETAIDAADPVCTVDLSWSPATSVCPGPIDYVVYRSTFTPVVPVPGNMVAGGLTGTTYTDHENLQSSQAYFYTVQARDLSTGKFDGNTVTLAETPTGPNDGIQDFYEEGFSDAMTLADWTITTGPGAHSCGEWAIAADPVSAPVLSSGAYLIADNRCSSLFARTSTTATSPAIDLTLPGLQAATLQVNVRFDYDPINGDETGAIEVWDGAQWIALWNSNAQDVNQKMSFDVTPHALNNPGFMVRFDYQDAVNASEQQYFSIDDVTVITDVMSPCATEAAGPRPVPAGSLIADRAPGSGTTIDLSWDAGSCPATDYNLLYGDLAGVASYALLGSECSLGTSGAHGWDAVPAGDLYFLLVGTDGAGNESSWGRVDGFAQRNGASASNQCGNATKDVTGNCL